MKTTIQLLAGAILAFLPFAGAAQQLPDTAGLTLDVLQIPNSPAFALMDLAPSTIDEPKVPSDFVAYLRNATDSFTLFPRSYGLEFAPAWVFGRQNISFTQFISNSLKENLRQSLVFSIGVNHLDDPDLPAGNGQTTQLGLGLKTSLLRGHVESSMEDINSLYNLLDTVNRFFYLNTERWLLTDREYKMWDDSVNILRKQVPINIPKLQAAGEARDARSNLLLADSAAFQQQVLQHFSPQLSALKSRAAGLKFNRRGFKLDLAGGFATDFYDQSFDNSQVTRIGAWLTGGWVFDRTKNNVNASVLGLLRVLGNPKQLYRSARQDTILVADNLYFDFGGRVILQNGRRFSLSGELLGRMPVNNPDLKTGVRFTLNVDYQLNSQILLSFNIGKNFDGPVYKGGNLITALHLFSSFGKKSFGNTGKAAGD